MITWNRLLGGRWFDAQVATDVLIGAALGCGLWIGRAASRNGEGLFRRAGISVRCSTRATGSDATPSRRRSSLNIGLVIFAVICFLRRLVRYDALAALATAVVFTLTEFEAVSEGWAGLALFVVVYGVLAFLLMRLGLVATISAIVFINAFNSIWLGADWKAWYAPAGIATILSMLSIALIAFWKPWGRGICSKQTRDRNSRYTHQAAAGASRMISELRKVAALVRPSSGDIRESSCSIEST